MLSTFFSLVVLVYSASVGLLYIAQRSLMYQPDRSLISPAMSGIPEVSPILITTSDGITLESWYSPPTTSAQILVYFHGNAGNIADRASKALPYINAGFGVMLVGYRGYGGNPGDPTETGLYHDASAALKHLKSLGFNPNTWVLYGESLGSGVAVEMAERYAINNTPVGALILEAPFTSMADAAAKHYPFIPARALVKDRYDSQSKIAKINTKLLILHRNLDRVVPFPLGKKLFDQASMPKHFHEVKGAGHNNLYEFGAFDLIVEFLKH